MAVSTVSQPPVGIKVTINIPRFSTLPITYTAPGVTADMAAIGVSLNNEYVFQNLTATTGTNSITISGTRWGEYDDSVTVTLILVKTAATTATQVAVSEE